MGDELLQVLNFARCSTNSYPGRTLCMGQQGAERMFCWGLHPPVTRMDLAMNKEAGPPKGAAIRDTASEVCLRNAHAVIAVVSCASLASVCPWAACLLSGMGTVAPTCVERGWCSTAPKYVQAGSLWPAPSGRPSWRWSTSPLLCSHGGSFVCEILRLQM